LISLTSLAAFIPAATLGSYDMACWLVGIGTAGACVHMSRYPASLGAAVLSSRPLTLIGRFSYSLYLTHFPLLALAAALGSMLAVPADQAFYLVMLPALPLIYLFAYVTYWLFERPFLRTPRRVESSPSPRIGTDPLPAAQTPGSRARAGLR
jgi:peptidoglycan/LPS O-acetylase OafA/YrhL